MSPVDTSSVVCRRPRRTRSRLAPKRFALAPRLRTAALAKPEVKEKFALVGTDVAPMGPAELGKFIQSEVAHWAKLVNLAGIEPE